MLATMTASAQSEHFRTLLDTPDFHIFYHAPVLILISVIGEGPWIVEDCSLAAENLMLAAYAEGLGTCWIGFAQGFLNTPEGKKVLGLPAAGCLSCQLSLDTRRASRRRCHARSRRFVGPIETSVADLKHGMRTELPIIPAYCDTRLPVRFPRRYAQSDRHMDRSNRRRCGWLE